MTEYQFLWTGTTCTLAINNRSDGLAWRNHFLKMTVFNVVLIKCNAFPLSNIKICQITIKPIKLWYYYNDKYIHEMATLWNNICQKFNLIPRFQNVYPRSRPHQATNVLIRVGVLVRCFFILQEWQKKKKSKYYYLFIVLQSIQHGNKQFIIYHLYLSVILKVVIKHMISILIICFLCLHFDLQTHPHTHTHPSAVQSINRWDEDLWCR